MSIIIILSADTAAASIDDTLTTPPAEVDEVLDDSHLSVLCCQLRKCSAKWKNIGTHLGFSSGELDNIGATQNLEGPVGYLRMMLAEWMEWAQEDDQGSKQIATLGALKDAVRKAGNGRTANSLSLTREETNGNTRLGSYKN